MATVESKIWSFLKSKGLNDYGIAGLMGNLYAESALRSINLQNTYEKSLDMSDEQYTAAVDNGTYTNFVKDKAGYGLAQWTWWSRKQNLLNFAQSKGKSIGDLDMQLEFLYKELSEGYPAILTALKNAKSVLEASNKVLMEYERPADQGTAVQNKRAGYGQKYYDEFAAKTTTSTPAATPSSNSKMKYSDSNKPLVCMQTNSTCYQGTSKMSAIKGVLWHSTGANNPLLKRYVQPSEDDANYDKLMKLLGKNQYGNDWNHIKRQAGLNAWIGKLDDGTIATVQTMPWDYKPWGCGSGQLGSCNTYWIQFEICEDALSDKAYFDAVYKEACELTAYLCTMYKLDPKGTANHNGVTVPVILCHADAHTLKLGSNHGDVHHWFKKYGKTMDNVREDVAALMGKENIVVTPAPAPTPSPQMYRVRKSWADAASQKGAYMNLDNAKRMCDNCGAGYYVFDANGNVVYPNNKIEVEAPKPTPTPAPTPKPTPAPSTPTLKVGDKIKLVSGATYTSGKAIPAWVFKSVLYCRDIRANGDVVFSTLKEGAVTGVIAKTSIQGFEGASTSTSSSSTTFAAYTVKVTADVLNVRSGPSTNYKINTTVKKNEVYTIVGEDNGWGKLKSGAGWISLAYTKKA
jgi:hypothetical protein